MTWIDWIVFAACWSLIPACFILKAFTDKKYRPEDWCCEHGIAVTGWCEECRGGDSLKGRAE